MNPLTNPEITLAEIEHGDEKQDLRGIRDAEAVALWDSTDPDMDNAVYKEIAADRLRPISKLVALKLDFRRDHMLSAGRSKQVPVKLCEITMVLFTVPLWIVRGLVKSNFASRFIPDVEMGATSTRAGGNSRVWLYRSCNLQHRRTEAELLQYRLAHYRELVGEVAFELDMEADVVHGSQACQDSESTSFG